MLFGETNGRGKCCAQNLSNRFKSYNFCKYLRVVRVVLVVIVVGISNNSSENTSLMTKAINIAYDKALSGFEVKGVKVFDSSYDLANDYRDQGETALEQSTHLINWQCSKSAISGFVTSLGGLPVMAVGIPANLTSVLYIQLRMITAIAILAGFDPHKDQVKTFCLACLLGNSMTTTLKDFGIHLGEKVSTRVIKQEIKRETLNKINKAIVPRFITKFGSKGLINLGKMIPVLSGLIGALLDGSTTKIMGKAAQKVFIK